VTLRLRPLLIALALLVFAGAAAVLWLKLDYDRFLATPLAVETPVVFEIQRGDSLRGVARRLAAEGWLDRPQYLVWLGRESGLAGRIQPGEYRIEPDTRPRVLLERFARGAVIQYPVTIVEGWTVPQLRAYLRELDFLQHTLEGVPDVDLLQTLGLPPGHPEGRFLPDTYHFPRGTPDRAVLRRAYRAMAEYLAQAWEGRDPDLPLETPYEALILASIVEKETGLASERPQIAGVFIRRLKRGMRLQTDPTVIYGMGADFDGNIRRRDLRRDTPYNTYTRKGLPPTPIALPGRAAIDAVLHPAPGDALYFVARGDGSHQFSATLAEHNRAVRKYQLRR